MAQGNFFDSMPFHGNIETRARPHHSSPRGISRIVANWKTFQASSLAISCLNAREK
jgi:hypothetical protein